MSSFLATASKSGTAQTSTNPPYTVNSSASSTATSNQSQSDAQITANTIAQQVANSVAQNDANIISQTLALSPAGVVGTYNYLNISFAFKTSIGLAEYDGLIIPNQEQIGPKNVLVALTLVSNKVVYYEPYGNEIPNSKHIGTINTIAGNYGGSTPPYYGAQIIDGVLYDSLTPQSILSSNRISSIEIPINGLTYKIKIVSDLKLSCSIPITTETTLEGTDTNPGLQTSITGIQVFNKTPLYVNIVSNNGTLISSYVGVKLTESYSDNYEWNTLSLDFTYAYPAGSAENIYPAKYNFPGVPL